MQEECPDSGEGEQIPVALAAASLQVGFVPRGEIKSQSKQDYYFLILPSNTKSMKPGSAFPAYFHSFLAAGAEDLKKHRYKD